MWIDFNNTLFKTEDILYIEKTTKSSYGSSILALRVMTQHKEILKTYSNKEGQAFHNREEDYKNLFNQLTIDKLE